MTASSRASLPANARRELLRRFPELESLDAPAWIVGGAIRDLILDRPFDDVDLGCVGARAVAGRWAKVIRGRFVDLGRDRFPTFRIVKRGRTYDLSELEGGTIESDLARRDFTVNALAVAVADLVVVDPFDGLRDLEQRTIRMVRESNLEDDPLRVLRGIRLSVVLGFEVDPRTLDAFATHGRAIEEMAAERVWSEMRTILGEARASRGLTMLRDAGLDALIFGSELDDASLAVVERMSDLRDSTLQLAATMLGRSRGEIEAVATRWRWSREERDEVTRLTEAWGNDSTAGDRDSEAIALHDLGRETSSRLAALLRATGRVDRGETVARLLADRSAVLFDEPPLLDGHEIAAITGGEPGRAIGRMKRELEEARIRGIVRTRDEAVRWVVERMTNDG